MRMDVATRSPCQDLVTQMHRMTLPMVLPGSIVYGHAWIAQNVGQPSVAHIRCALKQSPGSSARRRGLCSVRLAKCLISR